MYAHAHADPPYPYLWIDNVHGVPGAASQLHSLLGSDRAPTFVAMFQDASSCTLVGGAEAVVNDKYRQFTNVGGIDIKILRTDPRP
jgi:hypothetical protein